MLCTATHGTRVVAVWTASIAVVIDSSAHRAGVIATRGGWGDIASTIIGAIVIMPRTHATTVIVRSHCGTTTIRSRGSIAIVVIVNRVSIFVVIAVSVVHRVHRRRCYRAISYCGRRRHRRAETIVVEAIVTRTTIVAGTRAYVNDHPRFCARSVPVEAERFKVLKDGERVELITQFVVWHDHVSERRIRTIGRNFYCDSLDPARANSNILFGVVVAVVGVKVDVYITPIGVVTNVLHVIIDRDRIVVVHHHRL